MFRKSGEAYSTLQIAPFCNIDDANNCAWHMIFAEPANVGAAIRIFWRVCVSKIFEVIEFLGELEDCWAFPVSSWKSSVFLTGLGYQNFTVYLCQFCIYFFLAYWTDAFCLFHSKPPIIGDSASIISDRGSRIMDMVIRRSYFRTFWTVEAEVTRRIEEYRRRMPHTIMRGK